jgi:hypothetical protein
MISIVVLHCEGSRRREMAAVLWIAAIGIPADGKNETVGRSSENGFGKETKMDLLVFYNCFKQIKKNTCGVIWSV